MYCPTSILKPFFIIWSSIVLKGWMTTYSERDKGKKRGKKKAVFTVHWMYLHPPSLTSSSTMRPRKAGETLFPAELGVRNSTWQPDERLQKMLNFWLKYFFTPCLQSLQKGQVRLARLVTHHRIYVCTLLILDAPYTVAQTTVLMDLTVYIGTKI